MCRPPSRNEPENNPRWSKVPSPLTSQGYENETVLCFIEGGGQLNVNKLQ